MSEPVHLRSVITLLILKIMDLLSEDELKSHMNKEGVNHFLETLKKRVHTRSLSKIHDQ